MANYNTTWPAEWVEMVKTMYPRGDYASTIALHINAKFPGAHLTRNAVIGKITRLGLERDEAQRKANRGHRRTRKPTWTPADIKPAAPKRPRIPTVHVSAITGAIIPGPAPTPPQPIPEPPAATGQPITIDAITARTCCWPIDPDGDHGWRYCGDPRDPKSGEGHDRGYCAAHRRRAVSRSAA